MIDVVKTLRVRKSGLKLREKILDRIKAEERRHAGQDFSLMTRDDLEKLRCMYRNIDDGDIYVLDWNTCFETGF